MASSCLSFAARRIEGSSSAAGGVTVGAAVVVFFGAGAAAGGVTTDAADAAAARTLPRGGEAHDDDDYPRVEHGYHDHLLEREHGPGHFAASQHRDASLLRKVRSAVSLSSSRTQRGLHSSLCARA